MSTYVPTMQKGPILNLKENSNGVGGGGKEPARPNAQEQIQNISGVSEGKAGACQ